MVFLLFSTSSSSMVDWIFWPTPVQCQNLCAEWAWERFWCVSDISIGYITNWDHVQLWMCQISWVNRDRHRSHQHSTTLSTMREAGDQMRTSLVSDFQGSRQSKPLYDPTKDPDSRRNSILVRSSEWGGRRQLYVRSSIPRHMGGGWVGGCVCVCVAARL